jgi:CxxC-x17-CxxC domain-containing protein
VRSTAIGASGRKVRAKGAHLPCPTGVKGDRLMEFHDKVLKCSECSAEFVFTAGEQMFFADKGFKNEPKRCKGCKAKRAEGGSMNGSGPQMRSETKTTCSQCGKETTVPFRPTQGRPVFCRECFQQRRAIGAP